MEIEINGRKIKLSNLEKIFWPASGYTKHDLLRYYIDVSSYLLPYLADRPIHFQRFPDGIEGKRFYQINAPSYAPSWVKTFPVQSKERVRNYMLVNDLETLVYVVNLACLEIHPWHSRITDINHPDYGIVDLDPQEGVGFKQVAHVAGVVKDVLDSLGLSGFPKTSGATGIQIYIPLRTGYTYEQVRDIVGFICAQVHKKEPHLTTMERMVKKRGATVYLDYLQNLWGKTINAPYTVRPVPGASVSTPLSWGEVCGGKVSPADFTITNIVDRVKEKGDLFAPVLSGGQSAATILRQIEK